MSQDGHDYKILDISKRPVRSWMGVVGVIDLVFVMAQRDDVGIIKTHGGVSRDLQEGLEYFSSVNWTRELIDNHDYEPTSISFREGVMGPREDTYFGVTLNTPETFSHWICLLHRRFPPKNRDRTLINKSTHPAPPSPTSSPDCIFLLKLGMHLWGFRDTMHGGAICSILDQTMSLCAGAHRQTFPELEGNLHTATLQVDFRKPILVPEIIYVECWMETRDRTKWMIKGCIKDATRTILAQGKGLWILTRPAKL